MIFITQGRYTQQAMTGMLERPEDRMAAVKKLVTAAGGRILDYYFTFGEYDFLLIVEAEDEHAWTSALIVAGSTGGVTDLRTTVAMSTADAKKAFEAAKDLRKSFRPAGTK